RFDMGSVLADVAGRIAGCYLACLDGQIPLAFAWRSSMWIDVRSALGRVARVQQGFDGGQTRTHVVGAVGAGELDRLQQQVQVFSRVVVEGVEVIIGEDAKRLEDLEAERRRGWH